VPTSVVFAVAASVFLLFAVVRVVRDHGKIMRASRTWLVVGGIFAAVAIYLSLSR
jgi:hypothetical protein